MSSAYSNSPHYSTLASSECCRARVLWKLWADATRLRAPKQQSIRILPIIRPWRASFLLERPPWGGSTVFRASAPSRGFIFQAQALHPVAAAQIGPKAARLLHDPKMSVPGMTSTDGTGEARRTSYRLRCAGPLPVLQSPNVVRLEFSGSFGLMQRGSGLRSSKANLRRCCGAPNGAGITQIIGAR